MFFFILKYYSGLRGHDPNNESAWQQTVSEVMTGVGTEVAASTWPIFMFLSLLVAAPYLVHKLVNSAKKSASLEGKNIYELKYYYKYIYNFKKLFER